jgi:hypothetical protein
MARTGRVYVLRDPDGNMVYCGSSEDPYRLTRHRGQCKSDGLASPLYRYANEHHGGMAGYTEEIVATITLPEDDEQAKALLRSLEGLVIRGLRAAHPNIQLKNRNSPRSENVRSRERMRAWRLRNGQGQVDPDTGLSTSYMAVRGRIYRQRRKDRQAVLAQGAAAHAVAAAGERVPSE